MNPLIDVQPVREIQRDYFTLLRRFFGVPYEQMKKYGVTPNQYASQLATNESLVNAFTGQRGEIAQEFITFWTEKQPIVNAYLSAVGVLKSFFGGDISPNADMGHFRSTLLYTDTIVTQCPILRMVPVMKAGAPQEAFRLTVKHALNVLRFEELVLADVEPPAMVITGSPLVLDETYHPSLVQASEPYILAHAKALLGKQFANGDEARKFAMSIDSVADVLASITRPDRALIDVDWSGTLEEQLVRHIRDIEDKFPGKFPKAGGSLVNMIHGRMLQANETVLLNSAIGATPLLTAPTSWQYLLWRYEYDAEMTEPGFDPKDLVISNAILTRGERDEVPLVSNVSLDAIIAMRKEGALASMRELMRRAVNKIDAATTTDLKRVSDEVGREVTAAFDQHHRELDDFASRKKRFYGVDVSSALVTGSLSLVGAVTGNIPLTALGVVSTVLFGGKPIPELLKMGKELQDKSKSIKRSPAAILLKNVS